MDMTSLSVFGFAIFKVVLWLIVITLVVAQVRRTMCKVAVTEGEGADAPELGETLWQDKGRIGFLAALFFAAIFYSQMEMGYRPKTVIQPSNPVLQQELRKLDTAEKPQIAPAEGDVRDKANADYKERNRAENKSARDAFMELPSD